MTVKKTFTLKHYIVMVLLSYESRTASFCIGPSTAQIQKLLSDKFDIKRTKGYIGKVLRELQTTGIIKKEARSNIVPAEIARETTGCYHVVDTKKPFMDICEVYKKLHKYEDTLRHQEYRRTQKDKMTS
ncbi:hypothetical protein ES705_14324 [subsurface metagenome]